MKLNLLVLSLLVSLSALAAVDADDTSVNSKIGTTAQQQGMSEADTEITRQVRQAIVNESSLSTYAQNIKIITINGKVTLKGPVNSIVEKNVILRRARDVAGANNVSNKISILTE